MYRLLPYPFISELESYKDQLLELRAELADALRVNAGIYIMVLGFGVVFIYIC